MKNLLNKVLLKISLLKGSSSYWELRYRLGGNSGAGSYNHLAKFKADVLNDFVKKENIKSIIEWGVGDGNQLKLMQYPEYWGIDISETVVKKCQDLFKEDKSKRFYTNNDFLNKNYCGEMCISLDVIYHLIEDDVYEEYMNNLFRFSNRYVCVYSSNTEEIRGGGFVRSHVKHRKFIDYIESNYSNWSLYKVIENKYPFDVKNKNNTSFSDFYFFKKEQ